MTTPNSWATQYRRRNPRRHRTVLATIAAASTALLLCAGCTSGGSRSSTTSTSATTSSATKTYDAATVAKFQQVLDATRAERGFPGVIAEVSSPAGTWIGTSGTTGRGQTATPKPSDRTRIGSVTKTMTATVLLQLAQEHKLSLDDTIGKYVPGMPNGTVATLRQLAEMTSGIPSYTGNEAWQKQWLGNPEKNWTAQELVDFEKGKPADFAPGKGWSYSNTNYVLLGMVIEKVTGKPIADVFQQRIFGPLKMTDSSFPSDTTAIADPHLSGITNQGQEAGHYVDATNHSPSIALAAGAVISTLADMEKWANALFTGKGVLDPATQQLRRNSIIHDIAPNTAQRGYGLGIGDANGWWGHEGVIPGFNTSLFHNYTLNTTIIVFVNSDVTAGEPPTGPATAVFAGLSKLVK